MAVALLLLVVTWLAAPASYSVVVRRWWSFVVPGVVTFCRSLWLLIL